MNKKSNTKLSKGGWATLKAALARSAKVQATRARNARKAKRLNKPTVWASDKKIAGLRGCVEVGLRYSSPSNHPVRFARLTVRIDTRTNELTYAVYSSKTKKVFITGNYKEAVQVFKTTYAAIK